MIEHYSAPTTLVEATRLMHEGKVTVLAGGTDLMPQTESGKRHFEATLLNIRRIDGINEIEIADDLVRIGALVTITDILENQEVAKVAPVLAAAAIGLFAGFGFVGFLVSRLGNNQVGHDLIPLACRPPQCR